MSYADARTYLEQTFPGIQFETFGSHLTGLATQGSDYDFLVGMESGPSCTEFQGQLMRAGFDLHHAYTDAEVERMLRNGEAFPEFTEALNPGLHFVAKSYGTRGNVDIIVCTQAEAQRRLLTLQVIRLFVLTSDPLVMEFVRSIKGNSTAYAALHSLVNAAGTTGYASGRLDGLKAQLSRGAE